MPKIRKLAHMVLGAVLLLSGVLVISTPFAVWVCQASVGFTGAHISYCTVLSNEPLSKEGVDMFVQMLRGGGNYYVVQFTASRTASLMDELMTWPAIIQEILGAALGGGGVRVILVSRKKLPEES